MELQDKIIESTREIFSSMLMMEVTSASVLWKQGSNHKDSVTGLIGLGGIYKGVLAIHMPQKFALLVTSRFLGMDVEEINADVEDAIGELANMLGGSVKAFLSENGRDINLSMPSTISGEDYIFQMASEDVEKTVLDFNTDSGHFQVELHLDK